MILIDLSQMILGNLLAQVTPKKDKPAPPPLDENLVRHTTLNVLRTYIGQFKKEYGEVVICCDNKHYWRKDYFPNYKSTRKKARSKSELDWNMIFTTINTIKQELKENFPYKVLDIYGAEADDIIGILVETYSQTQKIMIVSSDKDFLQLQRYGTNVSQYSPITKKKMVSIVPMLDLKEKIIRGDKNDGIPNILSPDDCFIIEGNRQASLMTDRFNYFLNENVDDWDDEEAKRNYSRNRTLIDLRCTPEDIQEEILEAYRTTKTASRSVMFEYFVDKQLTNLMDVINEF